VEDELCWESQECCHPFFFFFLFFLFFLSPFLEGGEYEKCRDKLEMYSTIPVLYRYGSFCSSAVAGVVGGGFLIS